MGESTQARAHQSGADGPGDRFPPDFSPEEAAFASELQQLFAIEAEDLPPAYVPTILESAWHAPVAAGFEQKTAYRVFRQLDLERRPLACQRSGRSGWPSIAASLRQSRRPAATLVVLLLLVMAMSVVLASPSFAAGLQVLLAGQTGVEQVARAPRHIATIRPGPIGAESQMAAPNSAYWLGSSTGAFSLDGAWLLAPEPWSVGPVVDVQYRIPGLSAGSGLLTIREFQLAPGYTAVLQVVQSGSASPVVVSGDVSAIYVAGGWSMVGRARIWSFATRSELMLQRGDTIIWMVGDPRDGLDEAHLAALAGQLQAASVQRLPERAFKTGMLGQSFTAMPTDASGNEIYQLTIQDGGAPSGDAAIVSSQSVPRGRIAFR